MKVCVLGGNGFIGSFLKDSISSKYEVSSPTRKVLDLRNQSSVIEYLRKNQFDVVINAAINSNTNMSAPASVASDNLVMFSNLHSCRNMFGRYINLCSGAVFDRTKDISLAKEEDIFESFPVDPYGMSKNICSRICNSTDNFFTIRIFGIIHKTEIASRLIPKILSEKQLILENRYFDYFYLEDILPVIYHYIEEEPKHKDLNLVYLKKMLLIDFAKMVCSSVGLDESKLKSSSDQYPNYTGDGEKLNALNLSLIGIENGIKRYFS